MRICCSLLVALSLACTLTMPLASMSNVTSTCGMSVWLPDLRARQQSQRPGELELLTLGFTQSLPALDPLLQQVDADSFLVGSVFECLTEIGEDGYVQPCLARSWQQIDARTWMLRLDRTACFQNGDALTSADVLATYRRIRRMLLIFLPRRPCVRRAQS